MALGSLGDVIFVINEKDIITFQDLKYKRQIDFAEHKIHLQKPIFEFVGYKADEITLTIQLTAATCVNVQKAFDKLIAMFEKHEPVPLYIGKQGISKYKWLIESVSGSYDYFTNQGKVLERKLDITLKEYILREKPK